MKSITIDIHCHPTMRPYADTFCYKEKGLNHIPRSGWREALSHLFGFTRYSQTDALSLMHGDVNVVFAAIYPMEKQFSRARDTFKKHRLIETLFNLPTGFGQQKIRNIRNVQQGYFREAAQEYHFLEKLNGTSCIKEGNEITYQLINHPDEIQVNDVNEDKFTVNIFPTIEGGHALYSNYNDIGTDNPLIRMDVFSNIEKIKRWKYKPVFITLAHHFWNGFCGHTQSIPAFLEKFNLVSQKLYMDEGISSFGQEVIKKLLDDKNGRILIDVKHMSYQSRKDYFRLLDTYYTDEHIPIIASHAGVRGNKHNAHLFYDNSINFSDEEIIRIAKSKGLFGIQFDKSRIASKKELRKYKRCINKDHTLRHTSLLIWRHIRHIAEVLDNAGLNAWDIQCIGSDYDGIVNPVNGVWTAAEFKTVKKYLLKHAANYMEGTALFRLSNTANRQIAAEEIINNFMGKNVHAFLERLNKNEVQKERNLQIITKAITINQKKYKVQPLYA